MIIAISQLVGAQGDAVGRATAARLGWPYFDREIIARAAAMANVSEAAIEQAERLPSLLTRMMEALGRYPTGFELADTPPGYTPSQLPSSDNYRALIERVIQQLEESTDCVIVGHMAAAILRRSQRALLLFITAPLDQRVRLLAAEEGLDREEATRRVRAIDSQRDDLVHRVYGIRRRDPRLYDLTLNTGRVPPTTAAKIVADLARRRED